MKVTKFENQLLKYLLIATCVPVVMLLATLWYYQASINLIVLVILFLICLVVICATSLYQKIIYQFRTLSNLLEGMSHGDYSLRGRRHQKGDALGELVLQINQLAETLTKQRFIARESQLLVAKVIQHINVAIVAVNEQKHIVLLNPAGEKLLNISQDKALGKDIEACGAQQLLACQNEQIIELSLAHARGKFKVVRDSYRENGQQQELFFITDVHGLLQENERQAWQNLIRVLSHEINNSLAPIASISATINTISKKQVLADDFSENLNSGLTIIEERAKSLTEFIDSYRQLSHLPPLKKQSVQLRKLLDKVRPLFANRKIIINCQHEHNLMIDPVQIEQVLINLMKNADEAMHDKSSEIIVNSYTEHKNNIIEIIDNGCGLSNIENLFTPFYTTKNKGSGIGLVLSRQILEAHGGHLLLANRSDQQGCISKLSWPI